MLAGPAGLFNLTAITHEIGHVFGAMHQREKVQPHPFYALAGLDSGYQFANVASSAPTGYISYDTVMIDTLTANMRLNFSTTTKWKGDPILCGNGKNCPRMAVSIGNTTTDNRRYVFETLQWLVGDSSLVLTAPTDPRDAVLGKLTP